MKMLQYDSQAVLELLKVAGPIIVGIIGILAGVWYNERMIRQKKHDDERKEIYKKLNSFYGPLLQLLGISRELYERFTFGQSEEFRTLVALLGGERFEGNDKILLEQILVVTQAIEKLIMENSGLVDDVKLQELLARAGAHFRILRLAYYGDLTGEVHRFSGHVFPNELTPTVEQQIKKLQARLEELNRM